MNVRKPRLKPWALTRLWRPSSYLRRAGWFESYRARAPVDVSGAPIPLLTYPAIEFLARRVDSSSSVFEYGSGSSTLSWANRVKHVESVEHDERWYGRIRRSAPGN